MALLLALAGIVLLAVLLALLLGGEHGPGRHMGHSAPDRASARDVPGV